MILTATVGSEQAGLRLDDGLKALFPQLSKGEIRRVIDWGGCTVNQALVRVASRSLRAGDTLCLGIMEKERCVELAYTRAELLYEDGEYLAVNKAEGFNCQRTPYQLKGTVEYAVDRFLNSIGVTEPARVIHRLDRGTSGVMFFPKSKRAVTHLGYLLKVGEVEKFYWALVAGAPEDEAWTVDAPVTKVSKFRYGVGLPGKPAVTEFRVLAAGTGATLLEARPRTGRTHQIRVHLSHGGLPIVGDQAYDGPPAARIMLHCRTMAFPARDGRTLAATAPVDEAFRQVCHTYGITLPEPA